MMMVMIEMLMMTMVVVDNSTDGDDRESIRMHESDRVHDDMIAMVVILIVMVVRNNDDYFDTMRNFIRLA